jgi:outer membrane protein OmpA-like peptidoglycan-associated protein
VSHRKLAYAFGFVAIVVATLLLSTGSASAQSSIFTSQTPEFAQNVKTVLFPFNVYNRVENPDVLRADADWLKQHPDANFWIQGRADSRGDVVYNLALSYRRAQFIKQDLMKSGVNSSQIGFATGWGKLYPVCDSQNESCWQDNRRADIVQPDHAL